ncbi:MAG: hypothetical protein IKR69_04325 [Bacteroidales bacterium]|nr:hypothetical protein [Bacteroidales bacterium]
MKKFALSLFAVLSIFACTPEKKTDYDDINSGKPDPGGIPAGEIVEITAFNIEGMEDGNNEMSVSVPVNAGRTDLSISLTPADAVPSRDMGVSADNSETVDYGLNNNGLYFTPKAMGKVTLTLTPRKGRLSGKKVHVTVTDKPAEPVAVSIAKTGSGYKDGVLQLTEGDSFSIKASVKDDKGNNSPSEPLTWEVVEGGDYIAIDKSGKVTAKPISENSGKSAKVKVTVTSTAGSASPLSDEVSIDIAAIVKITIDRSGSSANVFTITAGGSSLALKAKVYNSREEEVSKDIIWSKTAGDPKVTVDSEGKVTAEDGATQNATIQAKVSEKTSVYDAVLVKVVPLPAEVVLSNFSGTYTKGTSGYDDGDNYYVKIGNKLSFKATVSPAGADQAIVVESHKTVSSNPGEIKITTTPVSSGTTVQIEAVSPGNATFRVYVKSASQTKVNKMFYVNVDDYVASDIKPGDYVYYNSSTGKFKSVDCGLRRVYSPASRGYEASDGTRSSEPRPLSSPGSGYDYIGILASLNLPSSDDFLRLSLLEQCRNNTSDLCKLNTFRKSNLPGFENSSSVHALVLCKNQSEDMIFQSSTETIAQTNDKSDDGFYQYQLKNVVALSKNESEKGYGEYVKYGLLNHLLLNFYNTKLKKFNEFNVRPVAYVATMTNIPKLTPGSGKRSTGWFLPGEGEWSMISSNLELVSLSLKKSGFGSLNSSMYFWLPSEYDEENAMYGKPNGNTYQCDKNENQFPARPMLYL